MRSHFNSINKYGHISDADELPYQQIGMSDDPEKYMVACILVNNLEKFSKEEHRADQPYQQAYDLERYEVADEDMIYQKNYGIITDGLKKVTNLTGDTAKSIADYLIKPV